MPLCQALFSSFAEISFRFPLLRFPCEKRAALDLFAVFGGLRPHAPLRPSAGTFAPATPPLRKQLAYYTKHFPPCQAVFRVIFPFFLFLCKTS